MSKKLFQGMYITLLAIFSNPVFAHGEEVVLTVIGTVVAYLIQISVLAILGMQFRSKEIAFSVLAGSASVAYLVFWFLSISVVALLLFPAISWIAMLCLFARDRKNRQNKNTKRPSFD